MIGARIAQCRNCTQAELEERMSDISGKHYSRELVAKWEQDCGREIKASDLIVLSRALECTPNYLLGFETESVETTVKKLREMKWEIMYAVTGMFSELVNEVRKT